MVGKTLPCANTRANIGVKLQRATHVYLHRQYIWIIMVRRGTTPASSHDMLAVRALVATACLVLPTPSIRVFRVEHYDPSLYLT